MVALKKCFDAFRNSTDAQRTFREIMYLQVRKGQEGAHSLSSIHASDAWITSSITPFIPSIYDLHGACKIDSSGVVP